MNDVTTIKAYPTKISIEPLNSTTYEVNVEYSNKNRNYKEVINAFAGDGKYMSIIKLMDIYSKDKVLDMTTEE